MGRAGLLKKILTIVPERAKGELTLPRAGERVF